MEVRAPVLPLHVQRRGDFIHFFVCWCCFEAHSFVLHTHTPTHPLSHPPHPQTLSMRSKSVAVCDVFIVQDVVCGEGKQTKNKTEKKRKQNHGVLTGTGAHDGTGDGDGGSSFSGGTCTVTGLPFVSGLA